MTAQHIAIRPSVLLAIALCATHVAAAAAVWLAPIATWAIAALTMAIAASLVYCLSRQAALHAAEAIVGLEIAANGKVSFQTRRGEWRVCELLRSSYVSPRLTLLNLKPEGGRRVRHVVLVPDNVDPRDFRRLRTWLRWGAQPEG